MATMEQIVMPQAQVSWVWMKALFLDFNLTKSDNKNGWGALTKIISA